MRLKSLCTAIVCTFLMSGCASKQPLPLATVPQVDLERYMGVWYEIARYENRFEKGCVGASATYRLEENGVEVINRCFDANGVQTNQAKGHAHVVEGSGNAKLRVSFFWPFYGDYWVMMLAEDYRYVVVGEPSRNYFWILSRSKQLTQSDREAILRQLPALGYDASKLYWTRYV